MLDIELFICYEFRNKSVLRDALNHSSIKKYAAKFERLEFLGDRVLGLVIAEYLYENFKKEKEGELAKMQSAFVCADACYQVAKQIGIPKFIETSTPSLKQNKTVLADAMEAVIAAIFIDSDFDKTKLIINNLWKNVVTNFDKSTDDPKTKLQELTQGQTGCIPIYELVSIAGPDHDQTFLVSLTAFNETIQCEGKSKKTAEIAAARKFLQQYQENIKYHKNDHSKILPSLE